jgi:uncharacterized integral membrane protein (TIGR00698 family)
MIWMWSLAACVAAAAVAIALGSVLDISPIALALIAGMALSSIVGRWPELSKHIRAVGRTLLRAGVVLLGLRITLDDLADLGIGTFIAIVALIIATFVVMGFVARRFAIAPRLASLMSAGCAICGASAIAATSPVVGADEDEVAYSVAVVTILGMAATFALPALSAAIGLDDRAAGIWIGLSVHDVGQVVAAASTVGSDALTSAIPVKLARVLCLMPMLLVLSVAARRAHERAVDSAGAVQSQPSGSAVLSRSHAVPGFLLGFAVVCALRSSSVIPDRIVEIGADIERWAFAAALFALGTAVHWRDLGRLGARPAAVAVSVWIITAAAAGAIASVA